jgi:ribosomal protein L11 methylase PrmA
MVPGGRALFSGILAEEASAARAQLAQHGFRVTSERTAAEWVAFAAELDR